MDPNTKYDSSTLSHWIKITSLYLSDIGSPKRRGRVPTIVLMKTLPEDPNVSEDGGDTQKEHNKRDGKTKRDKKKSSDPLEDYDDFYYQEEEARDDQSDDWEGMLSRYGRYAYLIAMFEKEITRVPTPNMKLFNTFLETLGGSGRGEVWEYGRGRVVEGELDEGRGRVDVFGLDMYVRFCSKLRDYERVGKVLEMKKRHR